jgi:hypothetical protein
VRAGEEVVELVARGVQNREARLALLQPQIRVLDTQQRAAVAPRESAAQRLV